MNLIIQSKNGGYYPKYLFVIYDGYNDNHNIDNIIQENPGYNILMRL